MTGEVCDVGVEIAEMVASVAELELVATSRGKDFGTVEVGDSIDEGRSLREVTIEVIAEGSGDVIVLVEMGDGADVVSITRVCSVTGDEVEYSVIGSAVEAIAVV